MHIKTFRVKINPQHDNQILEIILFYPHIITKYLVFCIFIGICPSLSHYLASSLLDIKKRKERGKKENYHLELFPFY